MLKNQNNNYVQQILIQFMVVMLAIVVLVIWERETVYQIYVANQINAVGWVINGCIFILFALGIYQIIRRLLEYRDEDTQIKRFRENVKNNEQVLTGVVMDSKIAHRYLALRDLSKRRAKINHSALASTLLAQESTRNSFLKFVQNVLILMGVLGTIISLSIALLGASEMISSRIQGNGLDQLIFGMSTALSTTMTAIFAYLIFGYFFIRLTDVQTRLLGDVEEITTTSLLPYLQTSDDAVVRDYSESVQTAQDLIQRFDTTQRDYADTAKELGSAIDNLGSKLDRIGGGGSGNQDEVMLLLKEIAASQNKAMQDTNQTLGKMVGLLQQGFRLPED